MDVPEPMRTHWQRVIDKSLNAPISPDAEYYRPDESTRRTPLETVRQVD